MFDRLNHACAPLHHAFGKGNTYLVGSALQRDSFRDLDVRTVADIPKPLATLIQISVSGYLSGRVGHPVDYQLCTMIDGPALVLDVPTCVINVTRHIARQDG